MKHTTITTSILSLFLTISLTLADPLYAADCSSLSSSETPAQTESEKQSKKNSSSKSSKKDSKSKKNSKSKKDSKNDSKKGSKSKKDSTKDSKKDSKSKKKSTKASKSKKDNDDKSSSKSVKSRKNKKGKARDESSPKRKKGKNNKVKKEETPAKSTSKGRKSSQNSQSKKSEKDRAVSRSRKNTGNNSPRTVEATAKPKRNKSAGDKAAEDSLTKVINSRVVNNLPDNIKCDGLKVNSVKTDDRHRKVNVGLNDNFTNLPVTQDFIRNLEKQVSNALPDSISNYRVNLNVGNRPLSYYISKIDRLPEKYRRNIPFVVAKEPYTIATKGMEGDIVAMWHSHGRYFRSGSGWQWQRPFLFETAEDVFTMSYVLPYIVPMLENAGAYVMLPRERDPNINEVIVDNDTNPGGMLFSQTTYKEESGKTHWKEGEQEGFIYDLPDFRDTENPFRGGTYRQTTTIRSGKPSKAGWYADIPEDGEYAVYVSYKSLPNSTEDAHYTVNYSGGTREFIVNQTMGGGTWIYLGTFPLEAGYSDTEPVVTLTNVSEKEKGKIVTADAVKIGGGMGNIARSNNRKDIYYDPSTPDNGNDEEEKYSDNDTTADEEDEFDGQEQAPAEKQTPAPAKKGAAPRFSTSGMPRFVEGARYWLHWAGFPESIYSPYHGRDDYKDDYTARGHWVNYLAGGSRVLPGKDGLKIPVDISMALHSDAGKRGDDSIIGTLGIYYTNGGDEYDDGTPRINSRMLTDLIMREITGDIRAQYEPRWTRRSMWDKSYVEARVPEVPTTLIELMSHQNFGDMKYGLDPNFRFTVGRAIYKGMARFMAERKGRELVIQPLPVNSFAIKRMSKGKYKLTWQPTPDELEPSAMPDKYIIFERTDGNLGFRKIAEVKGTSFELKVSDYEVHSFKILAANAGGVSFPSEVLAFRESPDGKAPMLIVNGFTRVSGPGIINEGGRVGFDSENDFGVPYIRDISFSGHQKEFRRGSGNFGLSNTNYVTKVIAGNTFDFVAEHGLSLGEAQEGFVSASLEAVVSGKVQLDSYKMVDLILGKQKTTTVGSGKSGVNYRTFPVELQSRLKAYVNKGGRLLVSGQYVGSDLYDNRSTESDHRFAKEVLGISSVESRRHNGRLSSKEYGDRYSYSDTLNDKQYIVECPDEISPAAGRSVILEFDDTDTPAGILGKYGKGKVAVLSVPFESIEDDKKRDALMKDLLQYLNK